MLSMSDHPAGFLGRGRAVRVADACQHITLLPRIWDIRDPPTFPTISILFRPSLACIPSLGVEFGAHGPFADARHGAEGLPCTRSMMGRRTHSPPRQRPLSHLLLHWNELGGLHMSIQAVEAARTPCALDAGCIPTGELAGTQIGYLAFWQMLHRIPFAIHSEIHATVLQATKNSARAV